MPIEGKAHSVRLDKILTSIAESANMIIMALSYAMKTGDNSQLEKYVRDIF
jgi:hypothetical protein